MNSSQSKGLTVVAVSGGVDSVVLLHRLIQENVAVIVAHVDHGIRPDSRQDATFVAQLAEGYDVPFAQVRLELGGEASEESARAARYEHLESIRREYSAECIATAHHQDDVLETIVINIIRGTGWRGLASLRETPDRYRPLLNWSKAEVISYALEHGLQWREDATNQSLRYLRNRVRHLVIPKLDAVRRNELVRLYEQQLRLREEIETEQHRVGVSFYEGRKVSRYGLIMLPEEAAVELLRTWLGRPLERRRLHDLLVFAKVARPGAKWSLDKGQYVVAKRQWLIVQPPRD